MAYYYATEHNGWVIDRYAVLKYDPLEWDRARKMIKIDRSLGWVQRAKGEVVPHVKGALPLPEVGESVKVPVSSQKFETPILDADTMDRTAHQKYRLRSYKGTLRVYSTTGKMHKVKANDFFCIVAKGDNIFDWHWYQIKTINHQTKMLELQSLQTEKIYNWKHKGGDHFVIPTR